MARPSSVSTTSVPRRSEGEASSSQQAGRLDAVDQLREAAAAHDHGVASCAWRNRRPGASRSAQSTSYHASGQAALGEGNLDALDHPGLGLDHQAPGRDVLG